MKHLVLLATGFLFAQAERRHNVLLEWLKENGGKVHPNLEIRQADPDDPSSRFAMFTTAPISAKDVLLEIPQKCLITAGFPREGDKVTVDFEGSGEWYSGKIKAVHPGGKYDVDYNDGDKETEVPADRITKIIESGMVCDTVRNLIKELRLAEDSFYKPYVTDLLAQSTGQLPAAWSKEGKDLLLELLGKDLPPREIVGWSWQEECGGADDPLEKNAAMIQLQRGWDDVLVPVFDMMSHRNGRWLNTENSNVHWSKPVFVTASRDIKAGEELYTTYNFCSDCGGRSFGYGTPEILRDYGFVEQFPQRWFFPAFQEDNIAFELDEDDDGNSIVNWITGKPPTNEAVAFLAEQLERLQQMADDDQFKSAGTVPENEFSVIQWYHKSIIFALERALEVAKLSDTECSPSDPTCSVANNRYDSLRAMPDDLKYSRYTCEFGARMVFPNHTNKLEKVKSPYQLMDLYQDPSDKDTCLELDKIVQICGSYRPHYHEMMVHYTARFIPDVKRIVWVGGGDSMLLHEIIKYPNLELALGLEIDQTVTRKSFKHFGTQPHWDNDKVQWWYGDAAKSLLMLPKEYYGSFDMVLVDLSETVMSITVTDGLDIMGALSLLLKPEGILVKNELYMTQMSEIFEYAMQVHYYDVPVICSQALIFGSDHLDFYKAKLTDHGVDILWDRHLGPLEGGSADVSYNNLWHDFRRNSTHAKSSDELESIDLVPDEQERSPGVLMVLNAEEASISLQDLAASEDILSAALQKESIQMKSTTKLMTGKGGLVSFVFKEGYVTARSFAEPKYIAFDIHLWSAFDKMESIKSSILGAVGSTESASSYRIVAGGIFGINSWKDDSKQRGPRVTDKPNTSDEPDRAQAMDPATVDAITGESLLLAIGEEISVAVVCGPISEPCPAVEVAKKQTNVAKVTPLWTCDDLVGVNEFSQDGSRHIFECEKAVKTLLKEATSASTLRAIVVDPSAPFSMGQITHKIFSSARNRDSFLSKDIIVICPSPREDWHVNLLDRFRKDFTEVEPVFLVEAMFNNSKSSMKLALTSSGDENLMENLRSMARTVESNHGLVSDVRNVHGGMFAFQDNFVPTNYYLPKHYDQSAPLEQWKTQKPLGRQTVYQMEIQGTFEVGNRVLADFQQEGKLYPGVISAINSDGTYNIDYDDGDKEADVKTESIQRTGDSKPDYVSISASQVESAVKSALKLTIDAEYDSAEISVVDGLGDGTVIVALWQSGSLTVTWDGRLHIDLNIYTYNESEKNHIYLQKFFMAEIPQLKTVLHDQQPRGYGRVVNFASDIAEYSTPHWA